MPYVAREHFLCPELGRQVQAGERLDLTEEQAKAYKGKIRRTAQAKVRLTRR